MHDGAALGMTVDHPVAQQDAANQTAIPELVPASQLQPGLTDPDLKVEGWVKISPPQVFTGYTFQYLKDICPKYYKIYVPVFTIWI